jgi:hypothetical protein
MQCNIDAKGKAARLIVGSIFTLIGIVLLVLVLTGVSGGMASLLVIIAVAMLVAGLFGVFEGAAGWCALRAMGFRTRV